MAEKKTIPQLRPSRIRLWAMKQEMAFMNSRSSHLPRGEALEWRSPANDDRKAEVIQFTSHHQSIPKPLLPVEFFDVAGICVKPRKWYTKRELSPAELISAFAGGAKREILLYSQCLSNGARNEGNDSRTYFDRKVVLAFVRAARQGVRIHIVIAESMDQTWASEHKLLAALAKYEGKTVFIRRCRSDIPDWRGSPPDILDANFMVVDGAFIRYEEHHTYSTAYGVYNKAAGRALRERFLELWAQSESLNGRPPSVLHLEEVKKAVCNAEITLLTCREFNNLKVEIWGAGRDRTTRLALLELINIALPHYFGDETIIYEGNPADEAEALLTCTPGLTSTPPATLPEVR